MNDKKKIEKSLKIRSTAFFVAAAVFFSAFFIDLFRIQVVNAAEYSTQKVTLRSVNTTVEAARGEILDCNGVPLVVNEQINSIVLDASYFPPTAEQEKRNEILYALIHLTEDMGVAWNDTLPLVFDVNGNIQYKENAESDIAFLKSRDVLHLNAYATAQNCFDGLVEKFSLQNYEKEDARKIASVCYALKRISFSAANPYTFADDVPGALAAKIKENGAQYAGVDVRVTSKRKYTDGTIAPHILGVVGKLNAEEYNAKKEAFDTENANPDLSAQDKQTLSLRAYSMDDTIGKFGIESAMEPYLRGTNGIMTTTTDSDGNKTSELTTAPKDGDAVILTIDSVFQKQVQDALASFIQHYRDKESIPAVGSAVVIDVKTASVLACATYPSYDLSTYYQDYSTLAQDKASPLWNRALMSTYEPGSTMKPAMAVAGLEEGIITENTTIRCNHIYTQFPDTPFKCLGYHGSINVKEALNQSCNIYFYETGRLLGINKMNDYCTRFGLGQKTGVEIPESTGVLASISYREAHGGIWYPGDTVQAAIGQSDNLFTPIQLANYAATIANGGTHYQAHFVKSIKSGDYTETVLENKGTVVNEVGVSDNTMRIVKEGMLRLGSRLAAFKDLPVQVAAKTGTAESKAKVGGDIVEGLNGFMIAFAPYDDPEIAVAIAIENLNSGSATAVLMADIFRAYFTATGDFAAEDSYNTILN